MCCRFTTINLSLQGPQVVADAWVAGEGTLAAYTEPVDWMDVEIVTTVTATQTYRALSEEEMEEDLEEGSAPRRKLPHYTNWNGSKFMVTLPDNTVALNVQALFADPATLGLAIQVATLDSLLSML